MRGRINWTVLIAALVAAAFLPGVLAQQSAVTGERTQAGEVAAGALAGIPAQTMALAGLGVGGLGALLNFVYTTVCAPISGIIGAILGLCGCSGLLGGTGLAGIFGGSGLFGCSGLLGLCGNLGCSGLLGGSGFLGLCGNLGWVGIIGLIGGLLGGFIGVVAPCVTGAMALLAGSPIIKSCATIFIVVGRLVAYVIAAIAEVIGALVLVCGGIGSIVLAMASSACSFVNSCCTLIPCVGWCYNLCGWIPGLLSSCGSLVSYILAIGSLCCMDCTTVFTSCAYPGAALGILCGDAIAMIAPAFMMVYKVFLSVPNICATLLRCCPIGGWCVYCCESSIAWICNLLVSAVCGVAPVGVGGICMGISGILAVIGWPYCGAFATACVKDLRDACVVWCCL